MVLNVIISIVVTFVISIVLAAMFWRLLNED